MNTEIYEGRRIDKIVIEEDLHCGAGAGGHLWFCRCDCGRSRSWKEWQLVKGVRTGELLCKYCARLKRRFSSCCTFVYLIHATGSDYYKIGLSNNPEKRLATLRHTNPFGITDLKLVRTIKSNRWVECQLHWRYDKQRQKGEWFSFTPNEAEDVTKVMETAELSQTVIYCIF